MASTVGDITLCEYGDAITGHFGFCKHDRHSAVALALENIALYTDSNATCGCTAAGSDHVPWMITWVAESDDFISHD
jgi:hypothetical protein